MSLTKSDLQAISKLFKPEFAKINARFEQIDSKFEQIDSRFDRIDSRFEQIDNRLESMEAMIMENRNHIDSLATIVGISLQRNDELIAKNTALITKLTKRVDKIETKI